VLKVLIVDDHPMVARYTRSEVERIVPDASVATANSLADALTVVAQIGSPNLVLLDLMLPDSDGLWGLDRLRSVTPTAIVGIVSGETSPQVMRECFRRGARGYITKRTGADDFTEALRKLIENGFFYPAQAMEPLDNVPRPRLTARELDVLRALAIGKRNKQLAPTLNISESTFKTYLRSIYDKLAVRTRVEAVRKGVELGLIEPLRLK
jgi:DNA-binding NarL/FixJ family response regulator